MECTQRLESTQEFYSSICEKKNPEQIGFLGICGEKHPVKKGPNKIGRDPKTCNIVLNLNSISRQHAVINVLNKSEFMLMDLDSANKTKLMNKIIQPYIPHPINNGDMVQFGDVFGVFRLLEDDDDLPMTQALDIPETPISTKYVSKINKVPITTVPESPDVSDKDDSFIAPSQPKGNKCFKDSNTQFIKPSATTISIKPLGTNKIDNVFWSSSKRSLSLNSHLDESNSEYESPKVNSESLKSIIANNSIHTKENQSITYENDLKADNNNFNSNILQPNLCTNEKNDMNYIHSMETQKPFYENQDNIHDMETQGLNTLVHISEKNETENIYDMETQAPFLSQIISKNNITGFHDMGTQPPNQDIKDPQKNTLDSIYTAKTQMTDSSPAIHSLAAQLPEVCKIDKDSDKQLELCANNNDIYDMETQPFNGSCEIKVKYLEESTEKKCNSAKVNISDDEILFEELNTQHFEDNLDSQPLLPSENIFEIENKYNINNLNTKNDVKLLPGNSADCENISILPTQNISVQDVDDDLTDCEDLFDEDPQKSVPSDLNKSKVDFEDMLTQVIHEPAYNEVSELPTQIITSDNVTGHEKKLEKPNETDFVDLPTQIINTDFHDVSVISTKSNRVNELESPFKIPFQSPFKVRRKDINSVDMYKSPDKILATENKDNDENYYCATQDILDDLCTQKSPSEKGNTIREKCSDDLILPCSVEGYVVGEKFPHLENAISPKNTKEDTKSLIQRVTDINCVEDTGDSIKRIQSDPSDIELTPKKVRLTKFMDIDLPNSQEIKSSISHYSKKSITETSSESESECGSEDQCTPILFHKKSKSTNVKTILSKKFDIDSLPSRVITRIRKPSSMLQNSYNYNKSVHTILQPNFLTEQEEEIDEDIINENISRLKSKNEKSKNKNNQGNKSKKKDSKSRQEVRQNKDPDNEVSPSDNNKKNKILSTDKTNENNEASKRRSGQKRINEIFDNIKKVHENLYDKKKQNNINDTSSSSKKEKQKKIKVLDNKQNGSNIKQDSSAKVDDNLLIETTRTTRSKRKENTIEKTKTVEESKESKDGRGERYSRRKQQSKKTIDLAEEIIEVRRSTRQRSSREKKENEKLEKLEISNSKKKSDSRKREHSTIYSISSESGIDSPNNMKRIAVGDVSPPSPKRMRSNTSSGNTSLRSASTRKRTQYVLFTAFPCEEVRIKLEKLGAVIVTDVMSCTMVLTMQIKRTFKLLCAVGLGKPIVGPEWVQACADSNMIVDPWNYLLKDTAAEKRFRFNLERVLQGKRGFLKGYNVSSTPNVLPTAPEMKLIVECSGGKWKEGGEQWVCVSCSADRSLWPALKAAGATVVGTEFVLGGVLRQQLDMKTNKL